MKVNPGIPYQKVSYALEDKGVITCAHPFHKIIDESHFERNFVLKFI